MLTDENRMVTGRTATDAADEQKAWGTSGSGQTSIVHVTSPGEYGGLETVIRLLASAQRRAGHDVCVALLGIRRSVDDHPLAIALRDAGVTIEAIPRGRFPYGSERTHLKRVCRRVNAAVLHTHGTRPVVVASSVGRALGIGSVATVHGITGSGAKNAIMHRLEWRALRRLSGVIAVSRPLVGALEARGVPRKLVSVIPNGFQPGSGQLSRADARREIGIADDAPVLGWIGRLSREKGADVLLESLPHLGASRPTVVFIGDGPGFASLSQQAAALGVERQIRWVGAVPQAARLFSAFDGFVLSSRTEGTPMCLLEAMDARVPAIVTSVGGVPDIVSEREAVVVAPEEPAALAAAIDRLLGDPAAARLRADAAHRRVREAYDIDSWVRSHDQLYQSVIAERAPR